MVKSEIRNPKSERPVLRSRLEVAERLGAATAEGGRPKPELRKETGAFRVGAAGRVSRGGETRRQSAAGFTMVEIAISLAVIGFALVAIIGVLPTGMNVQRDNREETIINQDETILMNAIRNGAQGLDDLTNYVQSIVNTVTEVHIPPSGRTNILNPYTLTYTAANGLTNGALIVGLLSTPKIVPFKIVNFSGQTIDGGYYSNHVVAVFRSMSGQASDKAPQDNSSMLDMAFSYRLISEVVPFCQYDTNWIDINWAHIQAESPVLRTNEWLARSNYLAYLKNVTNNLFDVRLTFRWPQYSGNSVGNGRQVYRAPANGTFGYWVWTNIPSNFPRPPRSPQSGTLEPPEPPNRYWFCQPSMYVQGQ
jgi:type II secretory pathway pseudopilin PulG